MGLFSKLSDSLSKTRKGFVEKLFDSFTGKEIDDDLYDELEELLIQGDVGVNTAVDLVERLREREKRDKLKYAEQLKDALVEEIAEIMGDEVASFDLDKDNLNIILVVGVNGVGKTTSIGKIANLLKSEGHKVILGAGDTFRAAAAEQLKVWGDRVGCDVISHQEGADPAAVVFDAIAAAKSRKCNVLIVDTAGRLQNKSNLMNELSKMRKVIDREAPGCLKEVLLVLDATTGQNAISQAKIFGDATGVTGVVLTKLDGTAKGGVVIGIRSEFDLPVKLIGTGEAIDNMEYFDAKAFGKALFSDEESLKDKAEEIIEDIKEEVAEKVEELKEEVAELKQDAAEFKANAKVEMAELKQDVQAEAANLKANVKEEVQELKEDVEEFIADVQDDIADLMDAPQADDLEDAEETVEEKPRKKGFFSGLFGGRK
ncbi:MAG: signal recognition particle-docking protein FtsY [Peptococcaceae bacterium]|nr:signal recognition particle-docking protein FtsY [Peptococcaceae bacterium]